MNFLLSEDLREFRDVLRKFSAREFTSEYRRTKLLGDLASVSEVSIDARRWESLSELGIFAAVMPEKLDGLGFGLQAAEVIVEECARVLMPLPVFETIALGVMPVLELAEEEHKAPLCEEIASGSLRLTGGFAECVANLFGVNCSLVVSEEPQSGTFKLNGTMDFVPGLPWSNGLLVPAENDCGVCELFLIRLGETDGLKVEPQRTFDLLRPYSRVVLNDVEAELISSIDCEEESWKRLANCIATLSAAELVAVADAAIELSKEYVKTRTQFGRPVGSFQAVQHKLADMFMKTEQAQSLCRFAAWSADKDPSQLARTAAAAKGFASEISPEVVQEAIQVHGGIGFTYEYDLHLFLRRAKVQAQLFGSTEDHYHTTAETVLFEEPKA